MWFVKGFAGYYARHYILFRPLVSSQVRKITFSFHQSSSSQANNLTKPRHGSDNYPATGGEENQDLSSVDDDFYGIKSDKDAICFEDGPICLEKFADLVIKKKKNQEVVKVTSFGKVRADSWNEATFRSEHFPGASLSQNKTISRSEKDVREQKLCTSTINPNRPDRVASTEFDSKSDIFKTSVERDTKINYIDDAYFGAALSDYSHDYAFTNKTSLKSTKFDEELPYNVAVNNEEISSATETASKCQYLTPNRKFHACLTDIGKSTENVSTKENFCAFQSLISNKCEASSVESDDFLSEIDKQYFGKVFNKNRSMITQNDSLDNHDVNHLVTAEEVLSEIDEQYFGNALINDVSNSNHEQMGKTVFEKKAYEDMFGVENRDKGKNAFESADEDSIRSIVDAKTVQVLKDKYIANQENVNLPVEIDIKEEMPSERVSKESLSEAEEIVSNLRKKRYKTRVSEKGELILPSEMDMDSKGFRILSNQVPDLSCLTRDELLLLLKNNILYLNDDLLIIDKPYNLVIHDAKTNKEPSLSNLLDDFAKMMDHKSPDPKLYTVHRIDKETTGCLILARNEMMAAQLKTLFAEHRILKKYWIVTSRVPNPTEGVIDIPISEGTVNKKTRMVLCPEIPEGVSYRPHCKKGKKAVTHYRVLAEAGNAALVEVAPETGLKHQIRVHFGFGLNCPIIGDHKYSHLDKMAPQKLPADILQRLCVRQSKVRYIPMHIHSHSVTIPQILNGRNLFISAPLPNHMQRNLRSLKFKKK